MEKCLKDIRERYEDAVTRALKASGEAGQTALDILIQGGILE